MPLIEKNTFSSLPASSSLYSAPAIWLKKQVEQLRAPLQASWSSSAGFIEIAHRICSIALLTIVPLLLIGYGVFLLLSSKTQIPGSTPSLTILKTTEAPTEGIMADAIEIHRGVEDLLNHLEKGPAQLQKLKEQIDNFYKKHDAGLREQQLRAFELTDHNRDLLNELEKKYDALFIVIVPGRGDCLFDSLFRGLKNYLNDHEWPLKGITPPEDHMHLRFQLAEYMEQTIKNDEQLRTYTNEAIEAHVFVKRNAIYSEKESLLLLKGEANVSQQYQELEEKERSLNELQHEASMGNYSPYFDLLKQPSFFGSVNAIYAFSKLFPDIHIEVARAIQDRYATGYDPSFNAKTSFPLTLCLKDGNHFDYDPRIPTK